MKKLFCFLIAAVLLLSASCGNDHKAPVFAQSYTDVPGMTLQIKSVTTQDGHLKINVLWDNQTEYNATYGEVYSIDRLKDGQWVSCPMKENTAFIFIGYTLNAGQQITKTYSPSILFDISSGGTYRFKSSCHLNGKECKLWVEFTVSDDALHTAIPFIVNPVRTNVYTDEMKYPTVKVVNSVQDLKDYYNDNKDVFDLERKDTVYSEMPKGFLDVCGKYDEAYFKNNYLIFVILEAGSGSIRHDIENVVLNGDGKLSVSIKSIVPEVCTADMAQWHIILELGRDTKISREEDVVVYLDGKLSWDGAYVEPPQPEPAYKEPPQMLVVTPERQTVISASGYNWTYNNPDGTSTSIIADQAEIPMSSDSLVAITIGRKFAETVYAYAKPGQYEPTNMLGYMVKLHFDVCPTSISYRCWPGNYSDLPDSENNRKETVEYFRDSETFYAKDGGYIYEIAATWENSGAGYYGTANYYVYIVGGLVPE